jgi:DNA-binding winged helix-turn-helix (wHTH) protein
MTSVTVRFGEFELDLSSGDLLKGGMRVRLQYQPLQVLALLIENAGTVVTRGELRQRLWPDGTFVDFDHSVNAAIKRLRLTLGDSTENPLYIETLYRRGYRFVAPVERLQVARPQDDWRATDTLKVVRFQKAASSRRPWV